MARKIWQSRLEYAAFIAAYAVLRALPYRFAAWLLVNLTDLAGRLGLRRKVVEKNMRLAFPQWDEAILRREMRAHYRAMGLTIAETYLWRGQALLNKVEAPDWDNFEKAVAMGKGVVVVSMHMGNWELAGRYMAWRGVYKLFATAKPMRNPWVDRFTAKVRTRAGFGQIPAKAALRPILKVLRAGGTVVLLSDQNAGAAGVRMPFLGRDASIHTGAVRIAMKTGSPIVCIFEMRKPDGSHILLIEEPILPEGFDGDAAVDRLTRRLVDCMEDRIRACPSQWLWMHNRWKTPAKARPPAGEEDT